MNNKRFLTLVFWLFCLSNFILNKGFTVINWGPQSVHAWRQSDCASYALNYYQNNQPFFEPQQHSLLGKDGKVVSEFPVIYYVAGKLYNIFGHKEWVLRGINFCLFILGCTCLLWLGFDLLENKWLALIPPLITFTSPYLYYYALNYLPDVPALSLALIGLFLTFRYFKYQKLYWAYAAGFVFCLAALIKISSGISFVAVSMLLPILWFVKGELFFKKQHVPHLILISIIVIAVNFSWVQFAAAYNAENGNHMNLLGLFPIWDANGKELYDVFFSLRYFVSKAMLARLTWLLLAILILIIFWRLKKTSAHIIILTVLSVLGALVYSLFWFRAYMEHDYYAVNPFIGIIWVMLAGCVSIDMLGKKWKTVFGVVFLPVLIVAVMYNYNEQQKRNFSTFYKNEREQLIAMKNYAPTLGLVKDDKVISIPDASPNLTLYYLNQQGWTRTTGGDPDINAYIDKGAKYMVITDTAYIRNPYYAVYLDSLMGRYKDIYFYTLKK